MPPDALRSRGFTERHQGAHQPPHRRIAGSVVCDPLVWDPEMVKSEKVRIARHDDPPRGTGEGEVGLIGCAAQPGIGRRRDVYATTTQSKRHGHVDVFIEMKSNPGCHGPHSSRGRTWRTSSP